MNTGSTHPQQARQPRLTYRVVVDAELEPERAEWFAARSLEVAAGRTTLEVAVPDQAGLHAVLRRIHDLHLPLVSVDRIETADDDSTTRRHTMKPLLSALLLAVLATPLAAQQPALPGTDGPRDRWSLELRVGAALPTKDLGDADLGTGVGFEPTLAYRFLPHLAAYGGWDWHYFTADESFAGRDMDFEETGYVLGLEFEHPLRGETGNGPALRLRAGGTYNHIEIEDPDGDIIADTGHGWGWETRAALTFPLAAKWRVSPELRYRALSRDVRLGGASTGVDLNYLALDVGISRSF